MPTEILDSGFTGEQQHRKSAEEAISRLSNPSGRNPKLTGRKPILVIVGGASGSGKTTLARRLGSDLCLPVISRDDLKEVLLDNFEVPDRATSQALGKTSYVLLFRIVEELVAGGASLILESNFSRGQSERELAPLVTQSSAILVHCETSREVIERRVADRKDRADRHPGHFDHVALPEVLTDLAAGLFEPLTLDIPVLRVETTDGYSPSLAEIEALIAEKTGLV
jgi:predicted kinase